MNLQDAFQHMKGLNERIISEGKALITPALKAFMAAHPEVEALRWCQYAPYFNDGDACVFSIHELEVKLLGGDETAGDNEDGFLAGWGLIYTAERSSKVTPEQLVADLRDLSGLMGEAESAMRAVFGEDSQITVDRNGVATIDEYDHS